MNWRSSRRRQSESDLHGRRSRLAEHFPNSMRARRAVLRARAHCQRIAALVVPPQAELTRPTRILRLHPHVRSGRPRNLGDAGAQRPAPRSKARRHIASTASDSLFQRKYVVPFRHLLHRAGLHPGHRHQHHPPLRRQDPPGCRPQRKGRARQPVDHHRHQLPRHSVRRPARGSTRPQDPALHRHRAGSLFASASRGHAVLRIRVQAGGCAGTRSASPHWPPMVGA